MLLVDSANGYFLSRDSNGTYSGLGGEVYHNLVDTSLGGFTASLDRSDVLDFTQGIFKRTRGVFVGRTTMNHVSSKYFWLGK